MDKFNDFEIVQPEMETDEDAVISGISGVFPDTQNMEELEFNLKNKRNLIAGKKSSSLTIGKIPNIEKFDASYFGLTPDYADSMDPMGRLLLEKSYEAIIDSGYNPESLKGKNIGVFVGLYLSETEAAFCSGGTTEGLGITGIVRSFLANRISYSFGFHGPSLCVDTACSSSMNALHLARQAMKNNECEAAIVGGCNLCLNNGITVQLRKLGVVSPDGISRVLDEAGNGYCRAETVCSIFLQKRKDARRIYATVIHTKVNCDGYKAEGITYPSFVTQKQLLKEFYEECDIKPSAVNWLELHATGTRAGDREEIKAVEMFCENRSAALKVGSVRSNMGHAEAASSLCSIAKVIISMKSGIILPNINYKTPRNDIDALHNGLVEVITENTAWSGGLVGINSFGLGGANGHTLLKSFEKKKVNDSLPDDDLPRIVSVSGRTEEAVEVILSDLEKNPIDAEYVSLLQEIHSEDIVRHLFRGSIILDKNPTKCIFKEITHCPMRKRPIWYVFAGMGCQWPGMGKTLMRLPIFAQSIRECHQILQKKNIDLIRILVDENPDLLDNVLNCMVAITAFQIALVDVLKALNITPAGIIGHSAGETACAYADNCLTKEQAILCAYYRGLSCLETDHTIGTMAVVGLPYDELRKKLPNDVDIACWNSIRNCTIAGPVEKVNDAINFFQAEKIFTRRVKSSNIAFHSRYVKQVVPVLFKYLQKVIPEPRLRSKNWISTSVPKSNLESDDAKYCSATYLTNNLQNMVLFEEATTVIPENAIVIEVSPHSLLRAILKQSCKNEVIYVPLGVRECRESVEYLLKSMAKLFLVGETLKFQNLYPLVNYPVSKETRMIAPLVKWQHDRDWGVIFSKSEDKVPGERKYTFYSKGKEHSYMYDHILDGRNIMPGFGYLLPIWELVPLMYGKSLNDTSIVFEKLRFQRIVNMHRDKNVNVIVHIQKGSGNFEIIESSQIVLQGRVYVPDNIEKEMIPVQRTEFENDDDLELSQDDIYKEFELRGYGYKNLFRQMLSSNFNGTKARVKWNENWAAFLDTIAQTHILQFDARSPCLLTSVDKIIINLDVHNKLLKDIENRNKGIPVHKHEELNLVEAGGVQIRGIQGRIIPRRKLQKEPQLLVYKYVSYQNTGDEIDDKRRVCFYAHLIWQNVFTLAIKILEFQQPQFQKYYSPTICCCLNEYPHVDASSVIITSNEVPEDLQDKTYLKFSTNLGQIDANYKAHLLVCDYSGNFQDKLKFLTDDGFLIIKMEKETETPFVENYTLCCSHIIGDEKFIMLRRISPIPSAPFCLKITQTFEWLEELKNAVKSNKEIILYAERDPFNGILGFYNCLKKEMGNNKIRCFFILDDSAPLFSLDEPFFKEQLSKNMLVNVYKHKSWGCYVHSPIEDIPKVKTPYAFVNVGSTGDLRTLNWYQGNVMNSTLNNSTKLADTKLIHVHYAALNFKDVLLATGVLSYEGFTRNRIMQECLIGCEFCGRDNDGKRYMGMYPAGAISTIVVALKLFLWEIPDNWSLEAAATVPVVYLTVISAFFVHGKLKSGESVLIHSGAGGVGQAAVNIATYYNCTIFVTVGTAEKREFIKKTFPHIKDSHIGNSRDTTFEHLVMRETKGKGVDLVLNSLAEDKMQASIRCLAKGGRFLEIGKLDLLKDNQLGMKVFLRGISFHCVLLDYIHEEKENIRNLILERFQMEMKLGSIKPIVRTVFKANEVESAFRYMAAGKHIGKVLLKVRDEENDSTSPLLFKEAVPRFFGQNNKVYVICGGLGGMGLELTDWLVLRGAKKVVLVSRSGINNGYQKMRLNLWQSYGATVIVRQNDMSERSAVENLLQDAEKLGSVCAIFNVAGMINDKMLENQDISTFESVAAPKTRATHLLDQISRKLCPNLEYFVIFSSLACGYGNTAQANYGLANSCCERICEKRKADGLPGLAIQWGVVGDVGILTRMNIEKSCNLVGLKEQPIRSCLNVLDIFLNQSEVIVSSCILGDKNTESSKQSNLVDAVANILGIKDVKTISLYSPLPELGMDSISGLEIKQTLEQQYDIFLSPKEIITLTFAQLEEIQKTGKKSTDIKNENNLMTSIPCLRKIILTKSSAINLLTMDLATKLPSSLIDSDPSKNTVFCFPSTDGIGAAMEPLSKNLPMEILCFQYFAVSQTNSIEIQAEIFASYIIQTIPPSEEYNIIAYSYGVILAIETIKVLHNRNRKGVAVFIDGSIEFAKSLKSLYFGSSSESFDVQMKVIMDVVTSFQPNLLNDGLETELKSLPTWDEKLDYIVSKFSKDLNANQNLRTVTDYIYHRYNSLNTYHFHLDNKMDTIVSIIRAKKIVLPISQDTGLNKYFTNIKEELFVDETHFTILNNKKTAEIVENAFKNRL